LYVPLNDENGNVGLIVYDDSMQVVSMVKLPGDVKSAIDGSYIDTVYLYVWGDFGVA